MNYQPVIGLEIHVELNTTTKMFCRCSADYFGQEPNTHTCPVCLGLPGATPMINKQALESCMKIGLALNCSINESSRFERKNYLYPDLSKGYQISQYRWPLCVNGSLDVSGSEGKHTIRINRVHQEEDTGKLMHINGGTAIDFNRCGVPLVEIVTEPDFQTIDQVKEYAKKLQQLFRYLGVSNADMERGDMRLEANISVRPEGQTELPNYRVELKNINSFKFMGDAIEYEIKRQTEALEKGETLIQETRGWNQTKKETFSQRSKEEAHDYRYFPDPDLPELQLKDWEEQLKQQMPELPWYKVVRFVNEYQLTNQDAMILTDDQTVADAFEVVVREALNHDLTAKQVANYVINRKVDLETVSAEEIIQALQAQKAGVVSDQSQIEVWVKEVIAENSALVEQYKAGKTTVIQALVGLVMRKSQGKAEATQVRQLLESTLQ